VETNPTTTLYPGGIKSLFPPDGFWVGMAIKVFKACYLGRSNGIGIDGGGVPMGA
jgi:hypothetical protein